jgi:hypothetical protein
LLGSYWAESLALWTVCAVLAHGLERPLSSFAQGRNFI